MILLRPVLVFLLLGAILQSSKFLWYWYLIGPQCDNPSWSEGLLPLRVIQGVLIAWVMYAFGLMDEILRAFLGIRLTQGLGSPTSVDRVYSRISRWGEIIVEGIAVDDFPSLMGLYAGSSGATLIKRGNSNGRRPNPVSTTHANANKSLMRIDRVAATAHMWSVTPWSPVRRYKRVHVKGITLRLVQVKGILNFTFLALDKKRPPRSEQEASCKNANERHCRSRSTDNSSRGESSSGCKIEAVGNGCGGPSRGLGMDDPDSVDADSEEGAHVEEALAKNEQREEEAAEAAAPVEKKRRMSGTSMEAAIMRSLSSARPANGSRKTLSPSTTFEKGAGLGKSIDQQATHQDCSRGTVGAEDGGSSIGTGSSRRGDSSAAGRTTNGRLTRSMSVCDQQPPAEPVGNLGVMKVLGEAFMQRFDSYCRQVSSSLARMGEIKLIPKLWPSVAKWRRSGAPKNKKKRYEVGEIFLEDMCICVDAGVWSDLLGDHLGEVFSPEFRLEVKIGPQELLTPNGEGRPLSEIGGLVSDKLIRLLARLVMRETVKTSTLMSLVVTSLALDTDARSRRQKNLASPPTAEQEAGKGCYDGNDCFIGRGSGSGGGRRRAPPSTFGAVGLERRSQSLSDCRRRRSLEGSCHGSCHGDGIASSRAGSFILSDGEGSSIFGGDERYGGSSSVGSCRDGWGGRWMLKTRKSSHVGLKSTASWRRSSESGPRVQRIRPLMQQNEQPRRRPLSRGRKPPLPNDDGDSEDAGIARKAWLKFSRKDYTGRRGSSNGVGEASKVEVIESSPKGVDNREGASQHLETVAMAPPWMEGVEASADYECLKPALDVVKRTVLLAVLKETNRYADVRMNSSFTEKEALEKQNGWSWGRRQRDTWKLDVSMELKRSMEEELMAAKKAGNDVDRLIMTQLLAQVRETGPKNAFKALASIELSPLIQDLAAETRLSQRLENIGIDMSHVAQSLSGLTAGKVMEGFKNIVGRVGGEARRLKADAIRVQQELLDETGILPLLNETAGGKEVTSLVSSLSDILIGASAGAVAGGGAGNASPFPGSMKNKDSWERGVAVSKYPTEANRSVEKGLGFRDGVELEEIDEVDVVLQVLDLLEAVESLRVSIMNGDGVTLNNLEHAFGKVAGKIDVYLVLAAIESVLGLLLESLGKLPVGQSRFAGKGVECRVWNLDLKGLHVSRKNVDLVMKGFRLPKRGAAVKTPFGSGKIKRYKKRSRCFVVNLDWTMGNGKSAKAYLQPNDIVVLEGHEGRLSDEEEEEVIGRRGNGRVIADNSEAASGRFSDEYAGGRSWRETHKMPPPGDAGAQPIEADKGRWLSRLWSRRKSSGIAEIAGDSHVPGRKGEVMSLAGSGVGGRDDGIDYGYETRDEDGRSMVRRCASAPSLISPPRTKPQKKSKPVGKRVCRLPPSSVSTVENPKGLVVRPEDSVVNGDGVRKVAGRESRSLSDATSMTDACSMRRGGSHGSSQAAAFNEETLDDQTRGIMAEPTSGTEITPAPFLVARISGVVVELKDVMWSVKQTAFPRLEAAGSLQATVSGLSIELELDSDTREVGPVLEGDREVVGGGRSKSLRLTRLRVSAMGIKIHVNNSALSAVFNLAASAFEAAVKRHVVENVEAIVRKNLTSLLAIMNESEKLRILFRGGAEARGANGESGDGNGTRLEHVGTVFEKVIARSRSHHVVWAAGRGNVDKVSTVSASGFVSGGRERGRGRGKSSRKIGVRSGPSKDLAGDYKRTEPTGARRILVKRLLRGSLARPVDRNQSTERHRRPVASIKSSKKEGYKKKWLRSKAVRERRATPAAKDWPNDGDFSGGSPRAP